MNIKKEHKNAIDPKTGKLKPKYSDLPRYKAIFGFEDAFKNGFEDSSKEMTKDIVKKIVSFVKNN
jgi:hypothetical protein